MDQHTLVFIILLVLIVVVFAIVIWRDIRRRGAMKRHPANGLRHIYEGDAE